MRNLRPTHPILTFLMLWSQNNRELPKTQRLEHRNLTLRFYMSNVTLPRTQRCGYFISTKKMLFNQEQSGKITLFQLFGEDFVGETVGRKGLWLT